MSGLLTEIPEHDTYTRVMMTKNKDAALVKMLEEKRFTPGQQYGEVTYTRQHDDDARMRVVVRTGIPQNRRRGSLRVTLVHVHTLFVTDLKTYPIGRFEAIVKQGDDEEFVNSVLGTMRQAYNRGTEWLIEKGHKKSGPNTPRPAAAPVFHGGFEEQESSNKTPLDEI